MVYNWFARFWHNVERQRERELYADLHKIIYDVGWTYQTSFYGTTITPYDGFHYQARIEVVSNHELSRDEFGQLYGFLSNHMPDKEYTLYIIYDDEIKELRPK